MERSQRTGFSWLGLASWFVLMLSLSLMGASAQAQIAPGPLKDGGFEGGSRQLGDCSRVQGSLPMNWSDNSCWQAQSRIEYETTIAPARSGRALMVRLTQGVFQLVQPQTLVPDAQYRVGVWLRAQSPMVVKLSLRQSGPPYLEYGARTVRVIDEWVRVEVAAFSHGLWESSSRQAVFMVSSATPGTLWMDEASLQVKAMPLPLPAADVPAEFFGTHILHTRNVRSGMADSEAGSVRIWDSSQSQWHQVQKTRPRGTHSIYRWDALDERVALADQHKVDMLMVLGGYAPAWASMAEDADDANLPDCHRCDESPRQMADWQNWVADVVGRYKGRAIRSWEIWNEPNFPPSHPWCPDPQSCRSGLGSGYRGTPEQLLALQNEAFRIVRRVDPKAAVVTSGISYHHRNYLDYFLRIGGGKQADAIGYHIYLEGSPEMLMPQVLALRGMLHDHGLADKPLWSTESAIEAIHLDTEPATLQARRQALPPPTRDELGPAYLARFFVIAWGSGLGRVYHYAWDGQHGWPSSPTSFNRNNNATTGVNASGEAWRQVRRWMVGKRLVRMDTGQQNGLWRAVMRDVKGREAQVVWHPARVPQAPQTVILPAGATKVCDLTGHCRAVVSGSSVPVDFRPVLMSP